MSVLVPGQSRPGVQDGGDVEDDEHEHVAVVEPGEIVEPLAHPSVLQGSQTHIKRRVASKGFVVIGMRGSVTPQRCSSTRRQLSDVIRTATCIRACVHVPFCAFELLHCTVNATHAEQQTASSVHGPGCAP